MKVTKVVFQVNPTVEDVELLVCGPRFPEGLLYVETTVSGEVSPQAERSLRGHSIERVEFVGIAPDAIARNNPIVWKSLDLTMKTVMYVNGKLRKRLPPGTFSGMTHEFDATHGAFKVVLTYADGCTFSMPRASEDDVRALQYMIIPDAVAA